MSGGTNPLRRPRAPINSIRSRSTRFSRTRWNCPKPGSRQFRRKLRAKRRRFLIRPVTKTLPYGLSLHTFSIHLADAFAHVFQADVATPQDDPAGWTLMRIE